MALRASRPFTNEMALSHSFLDFFFKKKIRSSIMSPESILLGGVGFGLGLTGKLGRAWCWCMEWCMGAWDLTMKSL